MNKFLLSFVFFSTALFGQHYFDTVSSIEEYFKRIPEAPKSEVQDWFEDDFTGLYRDLFEPGFFTKFLSAVGIKKIPDWDPAEFKKLLKDITQRYSLTQDKDFSSRTETIFIQPGDQCIFFGDLHGALHSFARDLRELVRLGQLNEDLTLTNPKTYMVFMGDLINRSAPCLELLYIVLLLIERNPNRVIYLEGKHERFGQWENSNMREELRIRAAHLADPGDGTIPMKQALNKFFSLLPKSLEIYDGKKKSLIYCRHSGVSEKEIRRKEVVVLIEGAINLRLLDDQTRGLQFRGFLFGTSRWRLISCPVSTYQHFYKFYYDAFVILTMGENAEKSTLTLYSEDVRTLDGYTKRVYDIIFGIEIPDHDAIKTIYAKDPLMFGAVMPLTGNIASLGIESSKGLVSAVLDLNKKGGVDGTYFLPIVYDDSYIPRITRRAVDTFIKESNVRTLIYPVGTPTLAAYLDRVKKGEVSVFFPYTGAPAYRDPTVKHLINFRASYGEEVACLIDHIRRVYRSKKFAFFYQNDTYGLASLNAAHEIMKKYPDVVWMDIPYRREEVLFESQAKMLKNFNPEAIGFFSVTSAAQRVIDQVGAGFFLAKHCFAIDVLYTDVFRRFAKEHGINFTFSFIVPDPGTSDLEIVKEYRAVMDHDAHTYSSDSLEAFIAMNLIAEAMRNMQPPYTREKLMAFFEQLNGYEFKGLVLTFHPADRSLWQPIYISSESGVISRCGGAKGRINNDLAKPKPVPVPVKSSHSLPKDGSKGLAV